MFWFVESVCFHAYADVFSEMDPRIEDSVTCVGPDHWLLGSLYVCEVADTVKSESVASWKDNGKTYYVRKSAESDACLSGESAPNRVHHAGTSAAVWKIGGTFIKVKAWRSGMQLECDTIQFVKSSSVPVPEVIVSWVDIVWNRSFLILKALEGRTLDHVWDSLSPNQHTQLADTIASYCKELAGRTSGRLMTERGCSIQDEFLTQHPPHEEPPWRPWTLGPYSPSQLQAYLSRSSQWEGHIGPFYFYHADLGPSNILVSEDGGVVGIIDWESAAFYPRFWVGTKPFVSAGFILERASQRWAWAKLLAGSLERTGFPPNVALYREWRKAIE